ncbi:MAG: hypothetical protein NW223_16015 [Hyphomicrobiaceae bacterium]|nr:hypothetical protein [Hyphomicrobiaceae bacterium]
MSLLILLFKIAVPPVLVAGMSLFARAWGPTLGGLIMGLPWMTGPVLFFLGLDKGDAFILKAATGVELAVVPIVGYMFAYALVAGRAAWPVSLAAAVAAFLTLAALVRGLDIGIVPATVVALGALGLARAFLPRPKGPLRPVPLPAWDIPARMAATFALVSIIMTSADILGGQLSGIMSSFPVVLTVIGTFTHSQSGTDAVRAMLYAVTLSLVSFAAFFLTVGLVLPVAGLVWSYVAALCAALAISAAFLLRATRLGRRP